MIRGIADFLQHDPMRQNPLYRAISETQPAQPAAPPDLYANGWDQYGLFEPGNIDIFNRPQVKNKDGSVSTVRSLSFYDEDSGTEVLVPTVSDDGRIMSDDEAVDAYYRTGRHLGKFATPDGATSFADHLHRQQEDFYLGGKKR